MMRAARAGVGAVSLLGGTLGCTILLGENRSFHEVDGAAVPAAVQETGAEPAGSQAAVTATYESPQTAGDTNILAVGWSDPTANLVSVTDTLGNTYQPAMPTFAGNALSQAIWYAPNIAAAEAGANTVTVRFDTSTSYVDLRVVEYAGLLAAASFDTGVQATGATPPAATPALTTTVPSELLFAAGMAYDMFDGVGPAFTQRIISSGGDIAADAVPSSPGPYAAMPTLAHGAWLVQLAAFKPGP
jgi:hypothetical protein